MLLPEPLASLLLQLLIVALGFSLMLRARRVTRALIPSIGFTVLGPIFLSMVPDLAIPLMLILVPYLALRLLRHTLVAFLGKEATGTVLGTWTVRLIDVLVFLPFRGTARLLQWFLRRGS